MGILRATKLFLKYTFRKLNFGVLTHPKLRTLLRWQIDNWHIQNEILFKNSQSCRQAPTTTANYDFEDLIISFIYLSGFGVNMHILLKPMPSACIAQQYTERYLYYCTPQSCILVSAPSGMRRRCRSFTMCVLLNRLILTLHFTLTSPCVSGRSVSMSTENRNVY